LIWQARKLVIENRINIIQTHGYKENVLGFFLKKVCNKPWIGFAHGYTNENAKVRFYNKLDRLALRYPDIMVTVSNRLKNLLIESGVPEKKVRVIYNAIDKEQLNADIHPDDLRINWNIKKEDKLIGVIGRLSPEKGQEVFLRAFSKVLEKVPFAKGIIIGDGQEKEKLINFCLENGLKDKIIFTGYQNNIANFYQIIDLLVLPSFSEGLPNVVLEAMAFKIPVISTSVGGAPEIITDGQNGLLVPPGDSKIMAEKIIQLLSNDGRLKEIGKNGHQSLFPKFSPENRASQILSLYQELLLNSRNL
jgi:glycosyltransferase involved in cell wall biosynthesis